MKMVQARRIKSLKLGFTKLPAPIFRPVNKKNSGRFHVLLRKENGAWKIVMDADTREGASEVNFNKASPIHL